MSSTPLTPRLSAARRAAFSVRIGRLGAAALSFALLHGPAWASNPWLAQAGAGTANLRKLFGALLYLVMAVGLIFGVIKVIQGALALTQGEEGWGQIIGGAMIAAAPTIMVFAFEIGGVGGVSIQPGDIKP